MRRVAATLTAAGTPGWLGAVTTDGKGTNTMATQTAPLTHAGQDTTRSRLFVLFVVLAVTSAMGAVLMALWPEPAAEGFYSYGEIAPIRDRWWLVGTLLAAGFVINIPAQALAFMAERAHSKQTVVVKGASHVVMVSHPEPVAKMIKAAAAATEKGSE